MPAAVIAALIGAAASTTASVYGAHKQSNAANKGAQLATDAANHAADVNAKAAADALRYTQNQDALTRADAATTQRANYDQWASREARNNTLGQLIGLPERSIPAYSGLTASYPSQGGQAGQTVGQMAGASPNGAGDPQGLFNSLFPGDTLSSEMLVSKEADLGKAGIKVLRNAEGRAGKIQLPSGVIVDVVGGGGTGQNRKQWLLPGTGGPTAAAGSPYQPNSVASMLPWASGPVTAPLQAPTVSALMPARYR